MTANRILCDNHISWRLDRIFQEIIHLVYSFHISVMYISREASTVVDALTNHGSHITSIFFVTLLIYTLIYRVFVPWIRGVHLTYIE